MIFGMVNTSGAPALWFSGKWLFGKDPSLNPGLNSRKRVRSKIPKRLTLSELPSALFSAASKLPASKGSAEWRYSRLEFWTWKETQTRRSFSNISDRVCFPSFFNTVVAGPRKILFWICSHVFLRFTLNINFQDFPCKYEHTEMFLEWWTPVVHLHFGFRGDGCLAN